ncbi:unnamed protein product [Amoebophrya sp. A120]|nr:unnamed protein product [Amoebophrya sp. A120]|eukprot:GSA120T00024894001.1
MDFFCALCLQGRTVGKAGPRRVFEEELAERVHTVGETSPYRIGKGRYNKAADDHILRWFVLRDQFPTVLTTNRHLREDEGLIVLRKTVETMQTMSCSSNATTEDRVNNNRVGLVPHDPYCFPGLHTARPACASNSAGSSQESSACLVPQAIRVEFGAANMGSSGGQASPPAVQITTTDAGFTDEFASVQQWAQFLLNAVRDLGRKDPYSRWRLFQVKLSVDAFSPVCDMQDFQKLLVKLQDQLREFGH